jgi:hypothetical protein
MTSIDFFAHLMIRFAVALGIIGIYALLAQV